jgi:hypothetical protein
MGFPYVYKDIEIPTTFKIVSTYMNNKNDIK